MIVFQKRETRICPIEIFRAWDDRDSDVRMTARMYTTMFVLKKDNKPNGRPIAHFPKGASAILLRHAQSTEVDVRAEAILKLGYLADKNKDALAAVEKALRDREWWVRFHAGIAHFTATRDPPAPITAPNHPAGVFEIPQSAQ